jgi:nickel-dependent lactate racemase
VAEVCNLALVSAGGYPLDINLIQSHKSMDHAAGVLADDGVMIAVSECTNGMGSDTFMQWFDIRDTRVLARRLYDEYALNGHTALSIMKKLERLRIILVSSLPRETVEATGMIHAPGLQEALSLAQDLLGEVGLTYVFPCAWGILPVTPAQG